MRCFHVQRNFKFAYSKGMIHQNCCWLWRIKKHRFSSVPGALMWLWCSASCRLIKHITAWLTLLLCKRWRMICLCSLVCSSVSTASSGKPKYAVCHIGCWIWMCKLLEFPNLNQEPFSQSSHIDVRDSDLTPPRVLTAEEVCATAATFFRSLLKMPL